MCFDLFIIKIAHYPLWLYYRGPCFRGLGCVNVSYMLDQCLQRETNSLFTTIGGPWKNFAYVWDETSMPLYLIKPQKPTIARKCARSRGHTPSMAPHCLRMGLNQISGWVSAWFMRSSGIYLNLRYHCHFDSRSPWNSILGLNLMCSVFKKTPGNS